MLCVDTWRTRTPKIDTDKTEETSTQIFIPYDLKTIYTSCLRRRIVGGWGRPLLPEILGKTDPVGAKSPIFSRYSLVSAVTPSKKCS